jgi:hypothetical protein
MLALRTIFLLFGSTLFFAEKARAEKYSAGSEWVSISDLALRVTKPEDEFEEIKRLLKPID